MSWPSSGEQVAKEWRNASAAAPARAAGLADAVEESRLARTGRASLMDGRNSRGCLMLRNNKPIRRIEQADACRLRRLEHNAHGESQAPRAVAMAGAGAGPI